LAAYNAKPGGLQRRLNMGCHRQHPRSGKSRWDYIAARGQRPQAAKSIDGRINPQGHAQSRRYATKRAA
jgi:hypothetical protein